jgi:uncharacterized membrane protein
VKPKIFIRVFFIACIAAYPFLVYFGIQHLPPSFFGLALVVLLAMRFGVLVPEERPVLLPVLIVFLGYAITAAILKSTPMLLFYPALVNFSLCAVFLNSLRQEEPLLLRIIRARGVTVSIHGPKYLYRLTAIWAGFFAINGSIAIWTSTVSMEAWTLYNGLISYFIVAALMGVEWIFRRHYKKRKGVYSP